MIRNRFMNNFANEYSDTCIKNKQKFLFIKYHGDHNYKIVKIGKFMYCSTDYLVWVECRLCGCKSDRSFVKYNELLQAGFSPEFINKIDENNYVYEDEITKHLREQK
jgi:hypothetical protein